MSKPIIFSQKYSADKNLYLIFPLGGGGNWLSYLIHCLEHNINAANDEINFHNRPHSESVALAHFKADDGNDWKTFSSNGIFNLYIQEYTKDLLHSAEWSDWSFVERFNRTYQYVAYLLGPVWYKEYRETVDLQYDLMFKDPDRFCNDLFELLDQSQIVYDPNKQIVFDAIDQFKKTLPKLEDHFDNLDSFLWLCWCFGILHYENLPGHIDYENCTKEDLIDSILPRRQYFVDYTKPYMLL